MEVNGVDEEGNMKELQSEGLLTQDSS